MALRSGWSFLALGLCIACAKEAPRRRPPNLVLIVVDTLRADHADGESGRANTPAIDALGADGVRFENAFAHAPSTVPAHASLFASLDPLGTGVQSNDQRLPPELPLFTSHLASQGYTCQAVVSLASLWPQGRGQGFDRGFEHYGQDSWSTTSAEDVTHAAALLLDGLERRQPFFLFAHYSDPHEPYDAHGTLVRTAELALDEVVLARVPTSETHRERRRVVLSPGVHVLRLRGEEPFRLRDFSLAVRGVELPSSSLNGVLGSEHSELILEVTNDRASSVTADLRLWLNDAHADEESPARYCAETEFADRWVGELLRNLRRRGLYDSSLVVLTSDHGESLGEHEFYGHAANLYDELLHVPLIFKLPAGSDRKRELQLSRERLARHIDVVPTACELLGLPPMPSAAGISLFDRAAPRELVAVTVIPGTRSPLYALRSLESKLIFSPGDERFELFDVARDPGELGELFALNGDDHLEWQARLRQVAAEAAPPQQPGLEAAVEKRLKELGY